MNLLKLILHKFYKSKPCSTKPLEPIMIHCIEEAIKRNKKPLLFYEMAKSKDGKSSNCVKFIGVTNGDVSSKYEVGKLYPCTTSKDGSLEVMETEAQND